MIRDDRELLAELARLNTAVVPLAMSIMDGSVTAEEQYVFVERLINLADWLTVRVTQPGRVIEVKLLRRLTTPQWLTGSREQRVQGAVADAAGAAGTDSHGCRAGA